MGDLDNIFSRPRPSLSRPGRPCAVLKVRAQPWPCPPLLYAVSLLFPPLLTQYLFSAYAIQSHLHVIRSYSQWKSHIFLWRAYDTGKSKKEGNFWLPRKIRKECAPEFMRLADYVIPRNKPYTFVPSRWRYPWRFPASSSSTSCLRCGHLLCHPRSGTRCSSSIICEDEDTCVCNCYSLPSWFNRWGTVNYRL